MLKNAPLNGLMWAKKYPIDFLPHCQHIVVSFPLDNRHLSIYSLGFTYHSSQQHHQHCYHCVDMVSDSNNNATTTITHNHSWNMLVSLFDFKLSTRLDFSARYSEVVKFP